MANHAHSTRTPLLPQAGGQPPLLDRGAGRQPGPVTLALRAMRTADPGQAAHDAIEAIRRGLDRHFSETDRQRLKALRRRVADRIEFNLALLDALDGDTDREDGADAEPSLGSLGGTEGSRGGNQLWWSRGGCDDHEDGDDNGIGDTGGLAEQRGRFLRLVDGDVR